ncbi:MAG: DUF4179 domain-containing protein, partial [Alistipes sp.]|nr:DUF4179 domain-containing protein [Alistipes sp.]
MLNFRALAESSERMPAMKALVPFVLGIAAAAVMTVGTLAAVVSPGLRTGCGGQEALESSIYRLDRSETYNGWTVTLDECVGDDYST